MKDLSPTQKLDVVLNFMNNKEYVNVNMQSFQLYDIFKKETSYKTEGRHFRKILDRLSDDGFVDRLVLVNPFVVEHPIISYEISFDGELFIEKGGYAEQLEEDNMYKFFRAAFNVGVFFGGVAAGVYYGGYVYLWLTKHCYFFINRP